MSVIEKSNYSFYFIVCISFLFIYLFSGSATQYFKKLHKLIEDTYHTNGNEKIMLLSHSMGAPYTLYFLERQPQEWKDKYIQAWITISGKSTEFTYVVTYCIKIIVIVIDVIVIVVVVIDVVVIVTVVAIGFNTIFIRCYSY